MNRTTWGFKIATTATSEGYWPETATMKRGGYGGKRVWCTCMLWPTHIIKTDMSCAFWGKSDGKWDPKLHGRNGSSHWSCALRRITFLARPTGDVGAGQIESSRRPSAWRWSDRWINPAFKIWLSSVRLTRVYQNETTNSHQFYRVPGCLPLKNSSLSRT